MPRSSTSLNALKGKRGRNVDPDPLRVTLLHDTAQVGADTLGRIAVVDVLVVDGGNGLVPQLMGPDEDLLGLVVATVEEDIRVSDATPSATDLGQHRIEVGLPTEGQPRIDVVPAHGTEKHRVETLRDQVVADGLPLLGPGNSQIGRWRRRLRDRVCGQRGRRDQQTENRQKQTSLPYISPVHVKRSWQARRVQVTGLLPCSRLPSTVRHPPTPVPRPC